MSVRVLVKNGEPLEKTLRRLRKICNNEGLTRDLKRSAVYEKPSERRRRKEKAARFSAMLSARYADL